MASSLVFVLSVLSVQSTTGLRLGSSTLEKCVMPEPELQLRNKYRIALWTNTTGDADVKMVEEGVLDHPMLELVSDLDRADYVIVSIVGDGFQDALPSNVPKEKILLIDWSDGYMVPPYMDQSKVSAVFKRSYVEKVDGVLKGVDPSCRENCYPMAFGVMNQYVEHLNDNADTVGDKTKRPISLMCSLRPVFINENLDENIVRTYWVSRNRVLSWLNEDKTLPADARLSTKGQITGEAFGSGIKMSLMQQKPSFLATGEKMQQGQRKMQVSSAKVEQMEKASIGPEYQKVLEQTRIAITANPATYEGDHRFWEHLANGNAILSDKMWVPIPYGPKAGKHYMEYDVADTPQNKAAFKQKIHKMLDSPDKMKKMACAGMQLAMRHHRSVNRVDYIVRTMAEIDESDAYVETGKALKDKEPTPTRGDEKYTASIRASPKKPTYLYKLQ